MRYTRLQLREDLVALNMKLGEVAFCQLEVEGRNGYTAVDTTSDDGTVHECLVTGTPRECLNAINAFIVSHI